MKRLTLFAGHYGSGKTNIAVNYAMMLKRQGYDVIIADLDIVNPYFRTKDSERELNEMGIELISSRFANSNLDIPSLPQEMYRTVQDKSKYAVMDIGGDDAGAVALGRFAPFIKEENNYDMVFVVNFYRPLSRTAEEALEIMREIEAASKLKFTSIINNSNLGELTAAQDVLATVAEAERLSALSGLPIKMTSVKQSLFNELNDKTNSLFCLALQNKIF
ncbi:MAG: hypothetical protein E7538_01165 [Ruminococcaceae bacterium]|nr:hypothetical protein [Oscillospiraceae bacterium]